MNLSESAGNSFTLGPYVEVKGLTDDELIILESFLAHNPVRKLLAARTALEPFARAYELMEGWADDEETRKIIAVEDAQLRAARAAWRALGGEEK